MHQGRRELATERPGFPETQTHSRSHHRKQESSQGLSSAAPGVVVVGSTTIALLVEALALAGMLRFRAPATDLVSQQTQVRRASTWPEAMELAGRYAPCMVVTTEAMPQGVCDATGVAVERTTADDLLEPVDDDRLLSWLQRLGVHKNPVATGRSQRDAGVAGAQLFENVIARDAQGLLIEAHLSTGHGLSCLAGEAASR